MTLTIEFDREEDGRWIAGISEIPGCTTYGESREDALVRVEALALRVLADRLEHGEAKPEDLAVTFVTQAAA